MVQVPPSAMQWYSSNLIALFSFNSSCRSMTAMAATCFFSAILLLPYQKLQKITSQETLQNDLHEPLFNPKHLVTGDISEENKSCN